MQQIVVLIGAAFCFTPWASPPLALAIGMALGLTVGNPFRATGRIAKILLQVCVVLLGFKMELAKVLEAGASGFLFAATSIAVTLLVGWWLGRRLAIEPKTSALISSGTAICGGSAIAAVSSVLVVAESEIAVAIGTVFLLNAVALYLFPVLGSFFELTQAQFGTWAGIAIHDIANVVAACGTYGSEASQVGTAVKLSRVLWIVPLVIGMALVFASGEGRPNLRAVLKKVSIPWFIGLFLLASAVRGWLSESTIDLFRRITEVGFSLTLYLIGCGLSRKTLAAVGWRALVQGLLLWIFISTVSLLAVLQWVT